MEVLRLEEQPSQGIAREAIEPAGDEDEVGLEIDQRGAERRREAAPVLGRTGAERQRDVADVPEPPRSDAAPVPG